MSRLCTSCHFSSCCWLTPSCLRSDLLLCYRLVLLDFAMQYSKCHLVLTSLFCTLIFGSTISNSLALCAYIFYSMPQHSFLNLFYRTSEPLDIYPFSLKYWLYADIQQLVNFALFLSFEQAG